jgi:iron complex outermembrane receptor protein
VVTGARRTIDGAMYAEQAARARSTITEEYIQTQTGGQTVLALVGLAPGVNFTNNDAYGASGGGINLRGFDGNRVSLTFDGIQLNDSGNYAIFSSQLLDPELITRANVNLGTAEVDSPTASAVGGTVNFVTRRPSDDPGGMFSVGYGDESLIRLFGMVETGEFWGGTTAFASASYQQYDLFTGPGEIQRIQYNARVFHPLQGDDFISLSAFYNVGRNNFFRRFNKAAFDSGNIPVNFESCTRDDPTTGVADNDGSGSSSNIANPASCGDYYGLRINPVNVGNIRGNSRFSLTDSLTLTVDPSFQYVLASGGGSQVIGENDQRLCLGPSVTGCVRLNGDTDTLDVDSTPFNTTFSGVRLYSPSNTNTRRWGLFTGLIWDLNEDHRFRVNYTLDRAFHRQTGEYGFLAADGDPNNVWAGKQGWGDAPILTVGGTTFNKRNRSSIAELQQWSAEYTGDFFGDMLTVNLGVRAPEFLRDLSNFCYAEAGSTNDPICTDDPNGPLNWDLRPGGPINQNGTPAALGDVRQYIAPFRNVEVTYDDILPNVGVTFRPWDGHQVFVSYAEGLSAPRTDDLYNGLTPAQMQSTTPETTRSYDLGYRYQTSDLLVSAGLWYTQYFDRIERVTIDPGPPEIRAAANVGDVDMRGADIEVGWRASDDFTLYGSASYIESQIQDNLVVGSSTLLTAGKELPDRPTWTASLRGQYELGPVTLGLQGRYVTDRWASLVNDQKVDAYTVFDLDVAWDFGELLNNENTTLRLNVTNLFDERYIGFISTQLNNPGNVYQLGAPQTISLALRTEF